ncbi:MAG: hypothetical protein LBD41_04330 [Clostridiales Family XIII bacterium]|jgi:hypothetical protein|nr:hypothetical protein [Clostridiales Family XIII bacterium]
MDYKAIYFKIITNAKKQNRIKLPRSSKNYIYYELHHIKPKCLFPKTSNLTENPENGVLLTAREHYICHLLLQKIYDDFRLKNAFYLMNTSKMNSRQYQREREIYNYHFNWYNNGRINIKVKIGDSIPNGFIQGQLRLKEYQKVILPDPIIIGKPIKKYKRREKSIIELNSNIIFESLNEASQKTGLSKYVIRSSIKKRIFIDNFAFCIYYEHADYSLLKEEYHLNKLLPYSKVKEKYSNKIYKNCEEAEKVTGIPVFLIKKSICRGIPYLNSFFEIV